MEAELAARRLGGRLAWPGETWSCFAMLLLLSLVRVSCRAVLLLASYSSRRSWSRRSAQFSLTIQIRDPTEQRQ